MNDLNYIQSIRQLARNDSNIIYKIHAYKQMLARGITAKDVLYVLTSSTNEVIEVQKSTAQSQNERILVFDPKYTKDIIVVLTCDNIPKLSIITVEIVDDKKWVKVNATIKRKVYSNV